MKTTTINTKLSNEERETVLIYNSADKTWIMDTTVLKHANKACKQGWKQTLEYVYDDGTICGGVFEASARAITIRNTEKKQMSEKQMGNLPSEEDDDEE
jgi:hypothetical protein